MKTICELNGSVVMSQDGSALDAMQTNAAQYVGATARIVSDSEFDALMAAKLEGELRAASEELNSKIAQLFPGMNKEQRDFLYSLARGA